MFIPDELLAKAQLYTARRDIAVLGPLGAGKDGSVWRTSRTTSLKIHVTELSYRVERNPYMRLSDCRIFSVAGFAIPRIEQHDDELFAIEMTIVNPPFLLDFASAIFNDPPDFLEDEGHTFEDFIRAHFDHHADAVLDLYDELTTRTGIFLPDMHSQNVKFAPK